MPSATNVNNTDLDQLRNVRNREQLQQPRGGVLEVDDRAQRDVVLDLTLQKLGHCGDIAASQWRVLVIRQTTDEHRRVSLRPPDVLELGLTRHCQNVVDCGGNVFLAHFLEREVPKCFGMDRQ